MAKKTISNTFTVNTVDDGVDAQYIYLMGSARDVNTSITQTIPCEINVTGGDNLAMNSRGLNLVTINRQTLAMVDSINYDTYGEAAETGTGITNLITKLNTLDDSVFVCLVSSDAIGWSDSLITALQGYGMGDLPYTATGRYPFLFIGYKNLGKGNGLTRMRDAGNYYDVVEASVYIANGALTMRDGKDGIDGESAPYYFQEWFAWSNDASTASVTTPPSISGSWATYIPAQGSYAYLWRKSIRNVWNSNSRTYTQEAAQYFRMSGTNGTSITPKGNAVACTDQDASIVDPNPVNGDIVLYNKNYVGSDNYDKYEIYDWGTMSGSWEGYGANDGDSFILPNGHLMMFSSEANDWLDLGQFQGESGKTYYTHVAWATNVVYSGGVVTSVEGFVTAKSPNDTTHIWMGVLINLDSGQDPTNAPLYTWSNTKGVQGEPGNDAVRYELVPSVNVITLDEDEVPIFDYVFFSLYMTVGSNSPTIYSTVQQWQNGLFQLYYVVDGVKTEVGYDYMLSYNTKVNYHDIESLYEQYHEVTWIVKKNNSVIAQLSMGVVKNGEKGNTGARGKIGRFFYFAGTFNPQDNDPTHVFAVNDAQAPYFEHTENGQKRYHVFNYSTNGSYTMAQMWSISNQSWSNTPWEVMTNDFKYIITEALFSAYAHLGSFIISGDWMLSQYGTLVDSNGTKTVVNASNVGTLYNGKVPYMWFNPNDPTASTTPSSNYKFSPIFAVDGLTGATYQQNAYVDGTIVSGGSGKSKWEISPEALGIYQIPTIIGYDTQGNKKIQIIYDGDASDTYQVSYGGGLSFIEQNVLAGGFFKNRWHIPCPDYGNGYYTFIEAIPDNSDPRLYIQYNVNGTSKTLHVGVDVYGTVISSSDWPSYRTEFSNGRMYIDANGYIRVKGNTTNMPEGVNPSCVCTLKRVSSNTTLDRIYDTIIATQQGITLTLPSDAVNGQKYTIIPKTSCVLSCGNTSHRIRFGDDTVLSVSVTGTKAHYLIFDAVDKYWYLSWGAA